MGHVLRRLRELALERTLFETFLRYSVLNVYSPPIVPR